MSEFLMVVPEGWYELADAQAFVDTHSEATLLDLISRNEGWTSIEALMQDGGQIAPDASLIDFRMFRDGSATRIWYKLG